MATGLRADNFESFFEIATDGFTPYQWQTWILLPSPIDQSNVVGSRRNGRDAGD